MADQYILAIDQGTTGTTVLLFDHAGQVKGRAYRELRQHYPQPGWVEHDAQEIWEGALAAAGECLRGAGVDAGQVAGIGITNQRETAVVWDPRTGQPLHRAIVWQDRRTAGHCDRLNAAGLGPKVQQKTGLVIDAYFSATKIAWLLEHVPGLREKAERGEALFGNMDTWLIWQLSGRRAHVTDVSNASRTMIYNIAAGRWDEELLREFGIPAAMLPEVRGSAERYAETVALDGLRAGIPIAGDAGDQQAALFGQGCFAAGMAKNTYGTGCFLLTNTGETPVFSRHKLLTTVAWRLGGRTWYALEGSIFSAGATVQWLRDGLGIIKTAAETEALARSLPDNGGVYLVPAFVGLGAPHWDAYARGAILGLTRGTTAAHLARAALEAMAYQTRELVDTMAAESGAPLAELRVDGGAAANGFLLQFQADMLGVPVARGASVESTAKGAAMLAGLAVGYWDSPEQAAGPLQAADRFTPAMDDATRDRLYVGWHKALQRALAWAE